MYRNVKLKKKLPPSDLVPKPVMLSQRPVQVEKNIVDEVPSSQQEEEIPSSQNENLAPNPNATQSQIRFLSQRSQMLRPTQDGNLRGKNYFEISLLRCKIKVTDLGESKDFITLELSSRKLLISISGCEFMSEGDDPISFIRRLRSLLGSGNENSRIFIDGFQKAFSLKIESIKVAQKFLSGCIMREADKVHISQTSLVQCLFAVSSLKEAIADTLLRNVKIYVTEQ